MTEVDEAGIVFDVETERVLQILSSEIYDSPKAFLRENVQNAYDAILMRCTVQGLPVSAAEIKIDVDGRRLMVEDDGIGMTEDVLRKNFWRAGSSGKRSDLATRSGVIGTFGIGAMANFGVCSALRVESRSVDSDTTLISGAKRANLRIAKDCIELARIENGRGPGTTITAELDPAFSMTQDEASAYLKQYVRFLRVPVRLNGDLISQERFDDALRSRVGGFEEIAAREVSNGGLSALLRTSVDPQARVFVRITDVEWRGSPIAGEAALAQGVGQAFGYRNRFGLAPIPISGFYGLGGVVDLGILKPTAGREALSRESIQFVAELVALVEAEASRDIARTDWADRNQQFQQYVVSQGPLSLAERVRISVLPGRQREVALGSVAEFEPEKSRFFYSGRDGTVLRRFASEDSNLFHVSQGNPRRRLQLRFLRQSSNVEEVPDEVHVERIPQTQLTLEEAMFLVRLRGVLLDDYFLADVDAGLATISHGVSLQVERQDGTLRIALARDMSSVRMVVEAYRSAPEVFQGFVVDFVRQHVYPQIRQYVPSSTRQGREALYRRLKENEELFRYDESDLGEAEVLLADYLSGKADLEQVFRSAAGRGAGLRQEVRVDQVGSVEEELPDVLEEAESGAPGSVLEAAPPILRAGLRSEMKVLTVGARYAKLNGFQMFLSVAERLALREGEFLRQPHTTKLMWGSHRVIYVFTDSSGGLSLYYDLKLKEPLETEATGGAMFPTTTIVTKDRIFVPVPEELEPAFRISNGAKEFFVRFDTIP
ncbi:MAG: hypothetical protein F4060_10470 [Holophagales bacterium]|nr:hypothetical protein [Holophagales bacterium]MYG30914.1 hypothetical protein [Holophagales bacterium]MYI80347.1 hypothetical protein [Holophagales bacterium]